MTIETIAVIIIAAVLGLLAGHFISRAKTASVQGSLQTQLEQQQSQIVEASKQLQQSLAELASAREQLNAQNTRLALNQNQIETLTRERDQLQQRVQTAEEKSSQLQTLLSDSKSELASIQAKLHASTDKEQERQQQIQALEKRLTQHQVKIEQTEQSRNQLSEELATLKNSQQKEQIRATEKADEFSQLKQELEHQRNKTAAVESERNVLSKELATIKSSLQEKETHFAQQLLQLAEQKEILKKEFQNIANEIFEAKGKVFSEQSKTSLDAMLNPFREQINDFKGKVENLHLEGTKQQTEMRTELKQLQAMHQQMTQEAHNLATALQGQKKVQGNWGELVLENVLERSGLQLGKDYKREDSFKNDEGGRGRPDVVVYLPQDKHLIIDAKVSLNAYSRYINSEDEVERKKALAEHVKAIGDRIKELSDRDYYKLNGINSPEMVFMFIPIESAFVEALKADESLFQKAIEQNVLVATPTTLLTSLNIVRQLWRYEDQNKHTAELAKKAEGVFKKLKTFLISFEGVKKGIESAQDAYSKAENQLLSGKGNLVKQVSEFNKLAPAIKDQLPEYFTDKADLELNHADHDGTERLAIESSINTQQTNEREII